MKTVALPHLSVSNLAWRPPQDEAVAAVLREHGVTHIDVAPSLYFPNVPGASAEEISAVLLAWRQQNVAISGLQSLFFGLEALSFVGPPSERAAIAKHFGHVCRVASAWGARHLVFGSPKMRRLGSLSKASGRKVMVHLLRDLGAIADTFGCILAVEANPAVYGGDFLHSTDEAADIVAAVSHGAVRLNIDTGALLMEGASGQDFAPSWAPLLGYCQMSLPHLAPLCTATVEQIQILQGIMAACSPPTISLEMQRAASVAELNQSIAVFGALCHPATAALAHN